MTLKVSKESWDEVLTPLANSSNQELPAGDDNAPGVELLMKATSGEASTQAKPEEEAGAQRTILQKVACEDPDTNPREAVDHPALDDSLGVEAAGGASKTGMTGGWSTQ